MQSEKSELIQKLQNRIAKDNALIDELRGGNTYEVEKINQVIHRVKSKPIKPRYLTGIPVLDDNLGGFEDGTFINIAGNSFSGKTTLVLKILENISQSQKVMFFSFEMYEGRIAKKFNQLSDKQNDNFYIEQRHSHLRDIIGIIKQYSRIGVKFFAIDSRMKIFTDEKEEYQRNSAISRELSKLTQELGVVIILINQISEENQKARRLSFKGSGDQIYDTDIALFIVVDDKDNRTLFCEKDRIGERRWKQPFTLYDLGEVRYTKTTYEPSKNVEMVTI
jgi:replicative DNA helicase